MIDLNGKWNNSYVYIIENKVVGYIICSLKKEENLHIHRLVIKPEYQGKGLGTELISEMINGVDEDIKYITLKVFKDNIVAKRFYEKNKFRSIGMIDNNNIYRKDL